MRPALGGLLRQFVHHECPFVAERTDEKRLRVEGADSPGFQVFRLKVAKVEGQDEWRFAVGSGGEHMPILFIVGHLENQRLIVFNPRFREVRAEFRFQLRGQ